MEVEGFPVADLSDLIRLRRRCLVGFGCRAELSSGTGGTGGADIRHLENARYWSGAEIPEKGACGVVLPKPDASFHPLQAEK